jgi:hypothetical protein
MRCSKSAIFDAMAVKDVFEALLAPLREACENRYGHRLVSVVVYGSVGRGTPRADSDVDLLVVATRLPRGRVARADEFRLVTALLGPALDRAKTEGVDTRLSPILKTPDEVLLGSALFLDMTEDARILCDRDDFFGSFLDDFRERLARLGAKRIWKGDAWYWDLKPDYKPGEVFEI